MPVLIVTGAAAAGKSTVRKAMTSDPRVVAVEGDVMAAGAAAVADGRRDYERFWAYMLNVARELHENGLIPLFCCICLPACETTWAGKDQALHFLALVSNEQTVRTRIAERVDTSPPESTDFHVAFEAQLRGASVSSPHSLRTLDVTHLRPMETVAHAEQWVSAILGR